MSSIPPDGPRKTFSSKESVRSPTTRNEEAYQDARSKRARRDDGAAASVAERVLGAAEVDSVASNTSEPRLVLDLFGASTAIGVHGASGVDEDDFESAGSPVQKLPLVAALSAASAAASSSPSGRRAQIRLASSSGERSGSAAAASHGSTGSPVHRLPFVAALSSAAALAPSSSNQGSLLGLMALAPSASGHALATLDSRLRSPVGLRHYDRRFASSSAGVLDDADAACAGIAAAGERHALPATDSSSGASVGLSHHDRRFASLGAAALDDNEEVHASAAAVGGRHALVTARSRSGSPAGSRYYQGGSSSTAAALDIAEEASAADASHGSPFRATQKLALRAASASAGLLRSSTPQKARSGASAAAGLSTPPHAGALAAVAGTPVGRAYGGGAKAPPAAPFRPSSLLISPYVVNALRLIETSQITNATGQAVRLITMIGATGQHSQVYLIAAGSPALVDGIDNDNLVVKTFQDKVILKEGDSNIAEFIKNMMTQYDELLAAGLPIITIHNRATCALDGYLIVDRVRPFHATPWDASTPKDEIEGIHRPVIDQLKVFFDHARASTSQVPIDINISNFGQRGAANEVVLLDFMEHAEETAVEPGDAFRMIQKSCFTRIASGNPHVLELLGGKEILGSDDE